MTHIQEALSLRKWKQDGILFTGARLVLAGIFIYASIDKIIHPAAFAEAVDEVAVHVVGAEGAVRFAAAGELGGVEGAERLGVAVGVDAAAFLGVAETRDARAVDLDGEEPPAGHPVGQQDAGGSRAEADERQVGGDVFGEEPADVMGLEQESDLRFEDPLRYDLTARLVSGELVVRGELALKMHFRCSRCAEFFQRTVSEPGVRRSVSQTTQRMSCRLARRPFG